MRIKSLHLHIAKTINFPTNERIKKPEKDYLSPLTVRKIAELMNGSATANDQANRKLERAVRREYKSNTPENNAVKAQSCMIQ